MDCGREGEERVEDDGKERKEWMGVVGGRGMWEVGGREKKLE